MARTKVILDTDIGDDVDDALALALICALPEQLELLGVTTVFGNTVARARQAQTILQVAGEKFHKVPVFAGCAGTMASRKTGRDVELQDHIPGQASATWPDDKLPALEKRDAVHYLIETLMQGGGTIVPITIGALTNLAAALVLQPKIARKIPRIVTMAAEFHRPMAEWNIRCDPEAANIVFSSGIAMDVIPFNIGKLAMFIEAETLKLAASDRPMAKYLSAAIAAWRKAWKNPTVQASLFDPMAVACIVKPELFEWKQGTVKVELRGESTYGYTTFTPGEAGPHRVAWNCSREPCVGWYLGRILGEIG
jgi:purine nucleosidase/pyrimidine-specific ribonucleoside hydrolase